MTTAGMEALAKLHGTRGREGFNRIKELNLGRTPRNSSLLVRNITTDIMEKRG